MGEPEYICDMCVYFVDGSEWDESVCADCYRQPGLADHFKPRPEVKQ